MYTWKIGNGYQVLVKGYSMRKDWAFEDALRAARDLRKYVHYTVLWQVNTDGVEWGGEIK